MWGGKFFNSAVAKYSSLLRCDTSISQHTGSDSLELLDLEDKDTAFLQNVRTILPNDTVSQNYLTQWQCHTVPISPNGSVPELSHPMTQCPRTISPNDSVPELSRPMAQCPRTISPNDSAPELSHPMTQCPRTISTNDTVSQNYLNQWHSVPELSHPMTQCHTALEHLNL